MLMGLHDSRLLVTNFDMHFTVDFLFFFSQKVVYLLANQFCDKMGWTLGVHKIIRFSHFMCVNWGFEQIKFFNFKIFEIFSTIHKKIIESIFSFVRENAGIGYKEEISQLGDLNWCIWGTIYVWIGVVCVRQSVTQ